MIYIITNQTNLLNESFTNIDNGTVSQAILYLENIELISVDTETTGLDAYSSDLLLLQLGDKDNQFIIDATTVNIQIFKDILESKTLIFHNAKFDLKFLYLKGIWPTKIKDIFLAESVLKQGLPHNICPKDLKYIAFKYCNIRLYKSIRSKINDGLTLEVIKYAADDIKYLSTILEQQEALIKTECLHRTFSLENEFVQVLAYIELSGIRLDTLKWQTKIKKDLDLLTELKSKLNNVVFNSVEFSKYVDNQLDLFSEDKKCRINWASSKQVIPLFEDIGLELLVKDKLTGKYKKSVDASVIQPQINKHSILPIYVQYKQIEKTTSTYGKNWLLQVHPKTQRIHTQFKQLIDTGRLSSGGKNKVNKTEYINFLNIPQDNEVRNCIVPKEGYVFIDCDYTGQESIVLANKSQESNLIKFFNEDGGDLHSFVASKIYPECSNIPLSEIKTKYKHLRQNAKAANFAIA